ncbi:MAG: hypothetical protein M3419_01330 [Actinomycetota bacterium]|nr:hypothetical protein [Actinomycetota bacterium]
MTNTLTIARLRALPVLLAAGTVQWLLWQAGSRAVVRAVQTVQDPVRRIDASLTGQLVVDAAMTLVLVAGTWLVVATVMTVVHQTAPASVRRRCPTLAPMAVRRLVMGVLGTGVLAIPAVVTGTASATDGACHGDHRIFGDRSFGDWSSGDRGRAHGDRPLSALDELPYPDRPATVRTATSEPTSAADDPIVVRPGDSLWSLAAAADPAATNAQIAKQWPRWYVANREVIGPDPDLLFPGHVLHPPGRP